MFKIDIEKTFFLTSLTPVGYVMAYFFQVAYYNFFHIPYLLARTSIEWTILAASIALVLSGILLILLAFIDKLPQKKHDSLKKYEKFEKIILIISIVGINCFLSTTFYFANFPLLLRIILILFLWFAVIVLFVIGFSEKKKSQVLPIHKIKGYVLYGLLIFLYIILSYISGILWAEGRVDFQTTTFNNATYIVVGFYQDNLLLQKIDLVTKRTQNDILLIPLSEKTILKTKHLGELNFNKKTNKFIY
ncbi:MAG TPA: hypothetical protein VLG12_04930 [Candidatus Saccharimonadales bacterium]|nr:hypothetical protein [Candidatus Saccharimonadales bacterium]